MTLEQVFKVAYEAIQEHRGYYAVVSEFTPDNIGYVVTVGLEGFPPNVCKQVETLEEAEKIVDGWPCYAGPTDWEENEEKE